MSKKQITCVHNFLRSNTIPLMTEAINKIRNASKNILNAERIMCKKYRIGASRYKNIINNRMPLKPTDEWCKIINSVCIKLLSRLVSPSPPLKVEQVSDVEQAEQVVSEWQANSEREEKNISALKGHSGGAEAASEMSITFSDTSSTSSDRTIPLYMVVKNGNVESKSLILEFDIEKLVN
jgi:hypothetical protein